MRWLLLLPLLVACGGPADDDDSAPEDDDDAPPRIPAACEEVFGDPWTVGLLSGLDAVGELTEPYWSSHDPEDFVTVLFAEADSDTCALIHRGTVQAYGTLSAPPNLLTPLFGYQLPWTTGPDWVQPLADAAVQGDELRDWLAGHGVERATLLPAHEVTDAGFGVSALSHLQIAVHEGFHVDVQMPAWFGEAEHPWPAWDQQPARAQLAACYVDVAVEQAALADAVDAAWSGDPEEALDAYASFLSLRTARRADLAAVTVDGADGAPLPCVEAEAILELEEGLAEYAGWAMLRDAGQATDADVLASLRATTAEPFYRLGAGQALLALALDPEGFSAWVQAIAGSDSAAAGSVESVTRARLDALR